MLPQATVAPSHVPREQVEKCLKDFEGGVWAQAATWDEIIVKWDENCMRNHSHVIDIESDSTAASTPATRASSLPSDFLDESPDISDDSLAAPSHLPPSLPRFREERLGALARLERAEAAAQQITNMTEAAEAAMRQIDRQAERAFGFLQNAGESARLIGQEAQHLNEIMANMRAALQGAYPLHPFSGHRHRCQMSDLSVLPDLLHVDTREDVDC
ncbi:hypothetical protein B0H19DRAFT_1276184 [Mycena capillaripes]|nr:hypothetical protein B0H19DRAFT_1276184 [Mycena capillaripes]